MTNERQQFEAWAKGSVEKPDFAGDDDDAGWRYRNGIMQIMWTTWQAARSLEPVDAGSIPATGSISAVANPIRKA